MDRNLLVAMLVGTVVLTVVADRTAGSREWMSFAERYDRILIALVAAMVAGEISIVWITGRTLIPAILWMLAAVPAGLSYAVHKARRQKASRG